MPAPTFTNLTGSGASANTSFNTASISPTASRLILISVHAYISTGSVQPATPTVTGNGITYTLVRGQDVDNSGTDRATLFVFRGMSGSPSGGAVTIDFGAVTMTRCQWSVDQSDANVDTSGTNGSGAIVQTTGVTTASGATSASVNYPVAMASGNSGFSAWGHQVQEAKTPRASWTELADVITVTLAAVETQYFAATDTAGSATWATGSRAGGVIVEVSAAGGGPVTGTVAVTQANDTAAITGVITGTLPGNISNPSTGLPVEPESHGHNPVIQDGNGNLYRVMESDVASGNHPVMMKSPDGTIWSEVDAANRPATQDMEGTWVLQNGTQIILVTTRDATVWLDTFNTSDAGGNPDTWQIHETVDSGLSSSGVEQYASVTRTFDGQLWFFYSDTLSGALNQIAYRRRTGVNTYGSKSTAIGGNTAVSWTAPAAVLGADDVTHIVYKDDTNNQLFWRTLSSTGTLSSATRLDNAGTATDNIPHTNPVYYDDGGTEVIGVAYADGSDILKYVRIVGGTPQTPETISAAAITMDPGVSTNGGAVAHLAVNGTTVHAAWSDATTGDILRDSRTATGAWGTDVTFWASGAEAAWYVYNTVFTRGSQTILGIAYDKGSHLNDESFIDYNETTLTTGTVAVTQAGDVAAASGQLGYTGTVAVTQADQTATALGTAAVITYLNQYTLQGGTTSLTMVPPGGSAAGDLDIIWVANKNSSVTPTNPAGWTLLGQQAVGTGSDGVGTGQVMLTAWYRILTGASTNTSITITGANRSLGGGMIYQKSVADQWGSTISFGSDTDGSSTAFSATVAANLLVAVGDFLLSVGVFTLNTTLPGRGLTIPGITSTITNINSAGGAVGNQIFLWTDHRQVTAGTQSGASSTTATSGAATTGGAFNVRVGLSSGPTGTVAVIQADDAASAAGVLGYSGTVAVTQADQSGSAAGALGYTGTATPTQADDTAAATGNLGYSGTAAITQAPDTGAGVGEFGYSGTTATTQADQTAAAAGQLGYVGTASPSQAADIASASGVFTASGFAGSAAPIQADQTASAVGVLGYSGTVAATQAGQFSSAAGSIGYTGTAAITQADNTAAGSGVFTTGVAGIGAATQADQTAAGAGVLGYTGTAAVTQASDTASAAGIFFTVISGTVSVIQANQTATATGTALGAIVIRPDDGITPRPFTGTTQRP